MPASNVREIITETVSRLLGIPQSEVTEETSLQPETETICTMLTATLPKAAITTDVKKMTAGDLFEQFGV